MTLTSAPGKLIIAGEYAVLEGHPALVAAVSARATCVLAPGDELTVSGLGRGPHAVLLDGEHALVEGDDGTFGLIEAVLTEARARGLPLPCGDLSVDTAPFYLGDQKLGLGSSAAVAVSLAAMLLPEAGAALDPAAVRQLAAAGHDRFSGRGRGSGVDVAASSYGGVLRFERPPGAALALSSWNLCPRGVSLLVPFAGAAASTRDFLVGLRRMQEEDGKGYRRALDDIGYATRELLDAVSPTEDPRVFMAAIDRCRRAMQRLGEKAGLDIVSRPHVEIARLVRRFGGAGKPSGAGGGDVAVCFVPDGERDACKAALEAAGFPVVTPLEVAVEGARRE